MIRLFIVDDHPMIIEGIVNMLTPFKHIIVEEKFNNGATLLQRLEKAMPDVLLLDIHLPDYRDGNLLSILKEKYPELPVIIITNADNPYLARELIMKGCKGYLLKTAETNQIKDAIEIVHGGGEYIDPSVREKFASLFINTVPESGDIILTKRESEILKLIGKGMTNYEIADTLFLSYRTIENHRLSIYQKFGVNNVVQLVRAALTKGLLS